VVIMYFCTARVVYILTTRGQFHVAIHGEANLTMRNEVVDLFCLFSL
jgi:hypothetical protein